MNNYLTPEIIQAICNKEQIIVFIASANGAIALKELCTLLNIKWYLTDPKKMNTGIKDLGQQQGIRFDNNNITAGTLQNAYKPSQYKGYKRYTTK